VADLAGRAASRWRSAAPGEANGQELLAGDFVRWCRQVIDLLDQIAMWSAAAIRSASPRQRGDRDPQGVVAMARRDHRPATQRNAAATLLGWLGNRGRPVV